MGREENTQPEPEGRYADTHLLVAAVPNFGHGSLPLESPTNTIIDTLWFPP